MTGNYLLGQIHIIWFQNKPTYRHNIDIESKIEWKMECLEEEKREKPSASKMKYKMQREKSQELREKVKLLFNDPISHRNPHNTEVYLAKAPNRSKHPNDIDCWVNVHTHMATYINTHTYIYHKGTQYYRN